MKLEDIDHFLHYTKLVMVTWEMETQWDHWAKEFYIQDEMKFAHKLSIMWFVVKEQVENIIYNMSCDI